MPKYVIEREVPGAGKMSPAELQALSQKSCGVLRSMGPQIQWLHSYVSDDKIFCVYLAPNVRCLSGLPTAPRTRRRGRLRASDAAARPCSPRSQSARRP